MEREALLTAGELAAHLGGELLGDASHPLHRIASLESADARSLGFLADLRHVERLERSAAGCVIASPALRDELARRVGRSGGGAAILHADPYAAYARSTQLWASRRRAAAGADGFAGVHPLAHVASGAQVHASAHVGALASVGAGARVGAHARIDPQAHVGEAAVVGEHTWLKARAVLADGCRIGARGIVHSGAVIGADGFGFAPSEGRWEKIEQLGAVVIGDDVEIGANTCIDRGALDDTVVEDGVKIDNLVQVGHNVRIGAHTAIAGCVGIAGSAVIGRHCRIGGAANIIGHLEIADHVVVTAATLISRSIHKPGTYSGAFPFDDNASWEKNAATLRQLYQLRERVRALERK